MTPRSTQPAIACSLALALLAGCVPPTGTAPATGEAAPGAVAPAGAPVGPATPTPPGAAPAAPVATAPVAAAPPAPTPDAAAALVGRATLPEGPFADAAVKVYVYGLDQPIATATTDAEGAYRAALPADLPEGLPLRVIATRGGEALGTLLLSPAPARTRGLAAAGGDADLDLGSTLGLALTNFTMKPPSMDVTRGIDVAGLQAALLKSWGQAAVNTAFDAFKTLRDIFRDASETLEGVRDQVVKALGPDGVGVLRPREVRGLDPALRGAAEAAERSIGRAMGRRSSGGGSRGGASVGDDGGVDGGVDGGDDGGDDDGVDGGDDGSDDGGDDGGDGADGDEPGRIKLAGLLTALPGLAAPAFTVGTRATAVGTPRGLAAQVTDARTWLYVADTAAGAIRRLDAATGGALGAAEDLTPSHVLFDANDGDPRLYVTDHARHGVVALSALSAGGDAWAPAANVLVGKDAPGWVDGSYAGGASNVAFAKPGGLARDGDWLYVADTDNHRIRRIDLRNRKVSTIAGGGATGAGHGAFADGVGTAARFDGPTGIAVDHRDGTVFVADTGNHRIRKIAFAGGVVTVSTLAGGTRGLAEGTGTRAQFDGPAGLYFLANEEAGRFRLLVADAGNHRVRSVSETGAVITLAGTGEGRLDRAGVADTAGGAFDGPVDVAVDGDGTIFVVDRGNGRIRTLVAD